MWPSTSKVNNLNNNIGRKVTGEHETPKVWQWQSIPNAEFPKKISYFSKLKPYFEDNIDIVLNLIVTMNHATDQK